MEEPALREVGQNGRAWAMEHLGHRAGARAMIQHWNLGERMKVFVLASRIPFPLEKGDKLRFLIN